MQNIIQNTFHEAKLVLDFFMKDPNTFPKIEEASHILTHAYKNKGKVITCGNGGSMSDAMHFAEELSGKFRNDRPSLAAVAISDPSYISCVANDFGYEQVFARFIEGNGNPNDVLVVFSTSGNSKNCVNAVLKAKELGIKTIGLTGKTGGELAELVDLEIRAPFTEYADRAQEIHIKVVHALIHSIEYALFDMR